MGRRLGQHFLYDRAVLGRIVAASGVGPGDEVLEVGPGPGALTAELLGSGARVHAVELDRELYARLQQAFPAPLYPGLTLYHADAMRFDLDALPGPLACVANIPYQITTPLIFRLLGLGPERMRSMTLTIQKEVAERLAAPPGGRQYGVLSVMVQYRASVRLMLEVPRGLFHPPPKVDSACVRLDLLENPAISVKDERLFDEVVRTAFGQRRKTIRNSLMRLTGGDGGVFEEAALDGGLRAEVLGLREFGRLADAIYLRRRTDRSGPGPL